MEDAVAQRHGRRLLNHATIRGRPQPARLGRLADLEVLRLTDQGVETSVAVMPDVRGRRWPAALEQRQEEFEAAG